MKSPNIFSYGTTELTQDAVLAYIASWADIRYVKYPEYKVAQSFISSLIKATHSTYSREIQDVKVETQWNNIDVVIRINNDDLIMVIENKKGSHQHSNQLQRYKEIIKKEYPSKTHVLLYIQSVLEGSHNVDDVEKQGFKYISFIELLNIIEACQCKNQIIQEYEDFLIHHKELHEKWQNKKVEDYGWHDVYGLYSCLEQEEALRGSSWGYAANFSGGSQWFFINHTWKDLPKSILGNGEGVAYYLQLEQDCAGKGREKGMRLILKTYRTNNHYRWKLLEFLQKNGADFGFNNIEKAGKFRLGEYTSTAWIYLDGEKSMPLNEDGTLNYKELVSKIVKARDLTKSIHLE